MIEFIPRKCCVTKSKPLFKVILPYKVKLFSENLFYLILYVSKMI